MQTIERVQRTTITVPDYGQHWHMDDLIKAVKDSGSHFFDADSMRFFGSKLDAYCIAGPDGWYFVTSEKRPHSSDPRRYTVRRLSVKRAAPNDEGDDLRLYELEGFQRYRTLDAARTRARHYAKAGAAICPKCSLRLMLETQTDACTECEEYEQRRSTKSK